MKIDEKSVLSKLNSSNLQVEGGSKMNWCNDIGLIYNNLCSNEGFGEVFYEVQVSFRYDIRVEWVDTLINVFIFKCRT